MARVGAHASLFRHLRSRRPDMCANCTLLIKEPCFSRFIWKCQPRTLERQVLRVSVPFLILSVPNFKMAVPNLALRRGNLATGVTARPTRTSWVQGSLRARDRPIRTSRILPDVILTLVHGTRLLPWVVKIMSVPRSDSRAIPALRSPYTKARQQSAERPMVARFTIDSRFRSSSRAAISMA